MTTAAVTDSDHIRNAIVAFRAGNTISDLQARVIATAYHGGMSSALYSLSSCGAISDELWAELDSAQKIAVRDHGEGEAIMALRNWARAKGERGRPTDWAKLSW